MNSFLYVILFLLPINLGKHIVFNFSYVSGLLIDYLIPTVYVQDILVAIYVVLNIKLVKQAKVPPFFIWFLFSCVLSLIVSPLFLLSLSVVTRLVVYCLFMIVLSVQKPSLKEVMVPISIAVLLISILGIAQWLNQSSIFANYLYFGEQPYNLSTYGINIVNFFGSARVPPYSVFRHPNIFGGFLSILLVWLFTNIKQHKFYILAFCAGLTSLVLTMSFTAYASFIMGLAFTTLFKGFFTKHKTVFFLGILAVGLLFGFLKYVVTPQEYPSVYRRIDLLTSSMRLVAGREMYGVGPGLFTHALEPYINELSDGAFIQPVHNAFVLFLVEYGFIAGLFFLAFILVKVSKSTNTLLLVSLLQFFLLGSFDHYVLTIHQTQLLFWIIFGLL